MSLFCCSKYMGFLVLEIDRQESCVCVTRGDNNNRQWNAGAIFNRSKRGQWHEQGADHVCCS